MVFDYPKKTPKTPQNDSCRGNNLPLVFTISQARGKQLTGQCINKVNTGDDSLGTVIFFITTDQLLSSIVMPLASLNSGTNQLPLDKRYQFGVPESPKSHVPFPRRLVNEVTVLYDLSINFLLHNVHVAVKLYMLNKI